jgi:hypothetical protein
MTYNMFLVLCLELMLFFLPQMRFSDDMRHPVCILVCECKHGKCKTVGQNNIIRSLEGKQDS